MGLYTKLPDDVQEVDVIIAGGDLYTEPPLMHWTLYSHFAQVVSPVV